MGKKLTLQPNEKIIAIAKAYFSNKNLIVSKVAASYFKNPEKRKSYEEKKISA